MPINLSEFMETSRYLPMTLEFKNGQTALSRQTDSRFVISLFIAVHRMISRHDVERAFIISISIKF